ncbi:MAG: aminotransferase class V-fold PLP-dependent enzyme [Thioalkalivibrio sp.]|nr:aminotransferase class V-fold PLP-dependent enzyme [Thioalkalivibrio sp.]
MHPEFPQSEIIHLNHAAVGPWPLRTAEAVTAFARENAVTGSLHYGAWLKVEAATRVLARELLAAAVASDVAFVKNTSEALSIVAFGLQWSPGQNIVIPHGEFPSNRVVWIKAAERFGLEVREIELPFDDPETALLAACDRDTALLSTSAVQFATGLRLDLERLGAALRPRGVLFCVDAIQHLGALPFDLEAVQADFVMADAHKWLLAPEGVAIFYVRPELRERLVLQEYGWRMLADAGDYSSYELTDAPDARRFEPGSPNLLGIHALHASLSLLLETGMDVIAEEIEARWTYLHEGLQRLGCRTITPEDRRRHAGILTFVPARGDTESLYRTLQEHGVLCAKRGGGIRLSPHFYLTSETLDRALAIVAKGLRE